MKIYPNKKEATKALIGTSFALLLFAIFGFLDIRSISTEDSMFTLDWFYWMFKSFSIAMVILTLVADIF
jgi:predicted ferric reductase